MGYAVIGGLLLLVLVAVCVQKGRYASAVIGLLGVPSGVILVGLGLNLVIDAALSDGDQLGFGQLLAAIGAIAGGTSLIVLLRGAFRRGSPPSSERSTTG